MGTLFEKRNMKQAIEFWNEHLAFAKLLPSRPTYFQTMLYFFFLGLELTLLTARLESVHAYSLITDTPVLGNLFFS